MVVLPAVDCEEEQSRGEHCLNCYLMKLHLILVEQGKEAYIVELRVF